MIQAPISLGELVDKITILEIKLEHVTNPEQRHNIRVEHEALSLIYFPLQDRHLDNFHIELKNVNEKLWEYQDIITKLIRDENLDKLAFATVCQYAHEANAQRAVIKKQINEQFNSEIVEEKIYE